MDNFLHRADSDYLIGAPSISDEAARQLKVRSSPDDEERTTREVYEAAAEIRKRRPRGLVGYPEEEARIPEGVDFKLAHPRQRR
jgi:hypothetical protein